MASIHDQLLQQLPRDGVHRYWVAYSGGLDSSVLLHALVGLRPRLAGIELVAVHVHHGLSPRADVWAQHCTAQCASLGVTMQVHRVQVQLAPGMSPEDAARRARYAALSTLLAVGDCLLTAHHRDDQAETLLLQLLRGSGPRGLAGMPACAPFGAGLHARPLLEVARADLRDYAMAVGLAWVEDESNQHTGFDRNYLRHAVLPVLQQRWPSAAATLARAARHQAEAHELIAATAAADLARVRGPRADTLRVAPLLDLSRARQRLVVRAWLEEQQFAPPHAVHVELLLDEVAAAAADATPLVRWPGVEVRRYRDYLYAMAPLPPHDASRVLPWPTGADDAALRLPGGDVLGLGDSARGLDVTRLRDAPLSIRWRRGGERLQPAGHAGHQALKKLMQARGVLPWWRDRVPLLYAGEELAAVAGLWVSEPFATTGAGARALHWDRAGHCVAPD